jgi:hypothetical protein
VTPLGVRLAADMRITDPNDRGPRGFLGAALKVILLSPTLCIGYAGNHGAALGAIRQVASEELGADEARSLLLDAHLRSDPKADFLIASLRPSALIVVKEDRAKDVAASWIGDQEAFAEYQRFYHQQPFRPPDDFYDSAERAGDIEIAARMGNGMEAVVHGASLVIDGETQTLNRPEGGSHKTVGEAIVNVVLRAEDDLFKYSIFGRFTASLYDSEVLGAFSYSALASAQPGVGVIGLYFDQARLGVLYAPLLFDDPERYSSISREAFIERVHHVHGVSLQGLGS